MSFITENVQIARERIRAAALSAGRDPGEIRLLAATKMPCKELVYLKIGNILYLPACCTGSIYFMLSQYSPVCDAEILHEFFLCVVSD